MHTSSPSIRSIADRIVAAMKAALAYEASASRNKASALSGDFAFRPATSQRNFCT